MWFRGQHVTSDLGEDDAAEPAGVGLREHLVEQQALRDALRNNEWGGWRGGGETS